MKTKLYLLEKSTIFLKSSSLRCIALVSVACGFVLIQKGFSQSTSLSFTQITSDYSRPMAGAEVWYNTWQVGISGVSSQDRYIRFSWSAFQSASATSYSWNIFDAEINKAIDAKQGFSFGIMTQYLGGGSSTGIAKYGGGSSAYPEFLHNQMQAESVKDVLVDGDWVPNYNSNSYLTAYENLCKAINQHLLNTTYKGVRYFDVINSIDIRGYGDFGEWHNWPYGNIQQDASEASLLRIIDAHKNGFPDIQLSAMVSGFTGDSWSSSTAKVGYYLLTASNNAGEFGWRRDNWGATESYYNQDVLENNPRSYNGVQLKTLIMNKWQKAPVTGEPCCNSGYAALPTQVTKYHANSFGNGNYGSVTGSNVVSASKLAGARITLTGGSVSVNGNALSIALSWQNLGIAAVYKNWDISYELKNTAGNTVWTSNSKFSIKLFLPQNSSTASTDNFNLPTSIPSGTYKLNLIIKDPSGYRSPYPLAINGRNSDGSYTLANITLSSGGGGTNAAPVANAGSDQTITLPTSSVTLNGNSSYDTDGSITSYQWQQISGPGTSTFSSTSGVSVTVSNLIAGTYSYRLTVTDNGNASSSDDVTITVNPSAVSNIPPVANAGSNQTITLPVALVTLNSSSSYDPDGTIVSRQWQQISGPGSSLLSSLTAVSITVSNLIAGVYTYRLTVTDNNNATGTATVTVTVNPLIAANVPPVADAGSNKTITLPTNSVTLNGGSSYDTDGTISSYQWQQVSGPGNSTFSSTTTASITVSNLIAGSYVYRLTVKDNNNATSTDEVTVIVNPANNVAPVANAGPNRTITLPTNSATLNGGSSYDPDGTISGYRWQQVSGPGTSTFSSTTTASVTVSNLAEGTYVYRLTVTDNDNETSTDDVTVIVNPAPSTPVVNAPPVADAGSNRTITLPTNSVTLNGSSSYDPDGTIVSYQWQQVSGPNNSTLSSTTNASITVSNLIAGLYVYRLTVKDNNNATSTDDITVRVNAPANIPPVANAGPNRTITLPTNSATLNGGSSYDPDGTIASYQWQQLNGPSNSTFSSTSVASVTVSNLVEGVYVYRLTVRDNNNTTSFDNVVVTVNPAPSNPVVNAPPVADAGSNKAITLPASSTTLNGSSSYDPDGTIVSYLWQQVSGPGNSAFSSTTTASVTVSNLIQGTYVYRLTVKDNSNATATDNVTITVNPAANVPPVANAGINQAVTLTTNSATLDGSASYDSDGSIVSYQWQQVSGPANATFSANSGAIITVSDLQAGDYAFRLTVTDNKNATDTSTVLVAVIDNFRGHGSMTIFPNPATDVVNVRLNNADPGDLQIRICDFSGRQAMPILLVSKPQGIQTTSVNVSKLTPGIYTLEIIMNKNSKTVSKFIKQ